MAFNSSWTYLCEGKDVAVRFKHSGYTKKNELSINYDNISAYVAHRDIGIVEDQKEGIIISALLFDDKDSALSLVIPKAPYLGLGARYVFFTDLWIEAYEPPLFRNILVSCTGVPENS